MGEHNLHWDKASKPVNKGFRVYICKYCPKGIEETTKKYAINFFKVNGIGCSRVFKT